MEIPWKWQDFYLQNKWGSSGLHPTLSGIRGFITKDSPFQAGLVERTMDLCLNCLERIREVAKIYFIIPNDQSRNFIILKSTVNPRWTWISQPFEKSCAVFATTFFVHLDTSPAFPCEPVTIFTQGCDAKPCGKSSFHGHLKRCLEDYLDGLHPQKWTFLELKHDGFQKPSPAILGRLSFQVLAVRFWGILSFYFCDVVSKIEAMKELFSRFNWSHHVAQDCHTFRSTYMLKRTWLLEPLNSYLRI